MRRKGNDLPKSCPISRSIRERNGGYTLIELSIVMTVMGILVGIAIPLYITHVRKAQIVRAMSEIRQIATAIAAYQAEYDALPSSLEEVEYGDARDPWGNPYQYVNLGDMASTPRKDSAAAPLNTDYDLYSKGRDGKTQPSITAQESRDDIIRARNGSYFGLAASY
ncbi:MAG: prepilin-type N-terminal cleavage/methylation domain-containing protein [Nitrospinota bacterium]|nr:MAG: prepilin-type N-terminal cleavage/methylation domain-containing protein [Nitrospinota bacterium]